MKILYLIRGLPGSGKSTMAKTMAAEISLEHVAHFEADMYFVDAFGNYNWKPSLLGEAHGWCLEKTEEALSLDSSEVYVSNTFTTLKEMQPYIDLALHKNVGQLVIIERTTQYGNIHGVPPEAMERMASRFQSLESLKLFEGLEHLVLNRTFYETANGTKYLEITLLPE